MAEGADFEALWSKLLKYQGEEFQLISGRTLTYQVKGNVVTESRTGGGISRAAFLKAWIKWPVSRPSELSSGRGASYVWAILSDPRIAGGQRS